MFSDEGQMMENPESTAALWRNLVSQKQCTDVTWNFTGISRPPATGPAALQDTTARTVTGTEHTSTKVTPPIPVTIKDKK